MSDSEFWPFFWYLAAMGTVICAAILTVFAIGLRIRFYFWEKRLWRDTHAQIMREVEASDRARERRLKAYEEELLRGLKKCD